MALTWTDGRERTTRKKEREDQIRQKTEKEDTQEDEDTVGHSWTLA